jgi:hypothetical protein
MPLHLLQKNIEKIGNKVLLKPKYYNTKIFQRLANKYFFFSSFSILDTPLFQYLKNPIILDNILVLKLHPNTSIKSVILQYLQKPNYYSLNTSKILGCQTWP